MPSGMEARFSEFAASSTSSRVMVSRLGSWAADALVVGSVMGAEAGSEMGGACAGGAVSCAGGDGLLLPHQERCRTPPTVAAAVVGARMLHCAVVCDNRARGRYLDESCSSR